MSTDPNEAGAAGKPVAERLVTAPCAWCGEPVYMPPRGRRRRYCDQSCRQRAYELRTAAARQGADLDAGRIRAEPAERVVERTVLAKHPTRPADWEQALAVLAEQLRTGRIDPLHHDRIRAALDPVQAALAVLDGRQGQPHSAPIRAVASTDPARARAAARAVLAHLPDLTDRTSIQRLATLTGHDPDTIREALTELAAAGAVTVYRQHAGGEPVPINPYTLSPHAGFHITLTR